MVCGEETITVVGTSHPCKTISSTKSEDGKSEPARFWMHEKRGELRVPSFEQAVIAIAGTVRREVI